MISIDRRDFLRTLAAAGLSVTVPATDDEHLRTTLARTAQNAGPELHVAVVSDSPAIWRGAELSARESARSAVMFGGSISIRRVASAELAPSQGIGVIIGGASLDESRQLASRAHANDELFMNVGCADDDLRTSCVRQVFHIAPSRRMVAAADPNGTHAVVAWHPSLQRFGADTLNRRFTSTYASPMTSESWTAWCAVKAVWDAALRAKATTAVDIVRYLERDTSRFDGHKGTQLYFDGQHQLVQPLYLAARNNANAPLEGEWTPEHLEAAPSCDWRAT